MAEMEFDEMQAVKYIRANASLVGSYADDDILLVIDTIFEYFEKYDEADDFEDDLEELVGYVKKQLKKDKDNAVLAEDVLPIVEAELQYEDSLD